MGSVCGGGALLGDLLGVIRSMEREVLSLVSLSRHFNGHFPGEPGLTSVY